MTDQDRETRQAQLLKDALEQPGVADLLEAYSEIETVYSSAAAATAVEPTVVTTNTTRF